MSCYWCWVALVAFCYVAGLPLTRSCISRETGWRDGPQRCFVAGVVWLMTPVILVLSLLYALAMLAGLLVMCGSRWEPEEEEAGPVCPPPSVN